MTTKQRTNQSEAQLYRVLQRANLLSYYDTFIAQGGDDVQQLCEAGEDEFLEIMALVGMASKPLHVRRLQKTLQEWVSNPVSFMSDRANNTPLPGSISASAQQAFAVHSTSNSNPGSWSGSSNSSVSPPATENNQEAKHSRVTVSPNLFAANLVEEQIASIATAAERLARNLPAVPPKDLNPKKGINRELLEVMRMTEEDPTYLQKLRKYAAIYGRFDSKRKNDRPMSLHELSVNEASAQLCRFVPALLSRREDLFPLARQVVRESGYQYSKGHSRSDGFATNSKKMKLDNTFNTWLLEQLNKPTRTDQNGNKEIQIREISAEVKDVRDKIEIARVMIQDAKERNDLESLSSLQERIDKLTAQQISLLSELEEFTTLPESASMFKGSSNGAGPDDDYLSDSSNMLSGASSPAQPPETSKAKPPVDQTPKCGLPGGTANEVNLFQEGLRIAQQYGLADFAEELKELQQKSGEDDETPSAGHVKTTLAEIVSNPPHPGHSSTELSTATRRIDHLHLVGKLDGEINTSTIPIVKNDLSDVSKNIPLDCSSFTQNKNNSNSEHLPSETQSVTLETVSTMDQSPSVSPKSSLHPEKTHLVIRNLSPTAIAIQTIPTNRGDGIPQNTSP